MTVFQYTWGTERPGAKEQRHLQNMTVRAEQRRAALRVQYEAALAEVDEDVAAEARELEIVRLSTPGGRYNREVALTVASHAASAPAKRGRGRPRKYGPGDQAPPRPSRAKTTAGRLRAASMLFAERSKRSPHKKREHSGSISPVTASPARSVAPQVATAVGQALLGDTIAAKQEVAAPAEVVVSITETAIVASPAPVLEAPAFDSRAASERHREGMLAALREVVGGQELTADGEAVLGAFVLAHRQQHHECEADWVRGQNGAKRHDYDFTDPADATKVRPEIRALFRGFGLSRHEPIFDKKHPERGMSEEDLQAWMKQAYFNGVDYPKSDYDVKMAFNGSARTFFWKLRPQFEEEVKEERQRFRVWSFIERRLWSVEYYADRLARGEIDLTLARVRVMNDELCFIGRLKLSEQAIYRKVVDAMEWFEGFSRIDLLNWAGDDIANDRQCRIHQRFPGWAYPKELHGALLDGAILLDVPRFDYKAPSSEELVAFAEADLEGRIEAVRRFDNVDWADIEI